MNDISSKAKTESELTEEFEFSIPEEFFDDILYIERQVRSQQQHRLVTFQKQYQLLRASLLDNPKAFNRVQTKLLQCLEDCKKRTMTFASLGKLSQDLVDDLLKLVDIQQYYTIFEKSGLRCSSSNTIKGLMLCTIQTYLHKCNLGELPKSILDIYTHKLLSQMDFYFSNRVDYSPEECLLAFGDFSFLQVEPLREVIQYASLIDGASAVEAKFNFLTTCIDACLTLNKEISPYIEDKLNALRFLEYFSAGVFSFLPEQLNYTPKHWDISGMNCDQDIMGNYPELFLSPPIQPSMVEELANYLEQTNLLGIFRPSVSKDLKPFYNKKFGPIFEFFRLFGQEYILMMYLGSDTYKLWLYPCVEDSFPKYNTYLTRLFQELASFNQQSTAITLLFEMDFNLYPWLAQHPDSFLTTKNAAELLNLSLTKQFETAPFATTVQLEVLGLDSEDVAIALEDLTVGMSLSFQLNLENRILLYNRFHENIGFLEDFPGTILGAAYKADLISDIRISVAQVTTYTEAITQKEEPELWVIVDFLYGKRTVDKHI